MFKSEIRFLSLVFFTLSVGLCYASDNNTSGQIGKNGFLAVYKMFYVIDSTSVDAVSSHYMHLYLSPTKSVFQNKLLGAKLDESALIRDPKTNEITGIDASSRRPNPVPFSFSIEKEYSNGLITTKDRVFMDAYFYIEPLNGFQWHITGKEKSFMGYKVLEATTTYGCRKWVAWFTPNIPISEGPYKFHGLPGLIVQVADTRRHYVFQLESIEPYKDLVDNIDAKVPNYSRIKTTIGKFIEIRNRFTTNAANIVGEFTNDPYIRARATSGAARRNNFIELCAD